MAETTYETRLMLVLVAGEGAVARLAVALTAAHVSAVAIEPGHAKGAVPEELVAAVRTARLEVVVRGTDAEARAAGADGVQVPAETEAEDDEAGPLVEAARRVLGARAVVGVEAAGSRHRAMTSADAGADYVAFGLPPTATDEDRADRLDLVAWWAEIFETPCVALDVVTPEEGEALAAAGADLVALRLAAGEAAADCAERVRAIAAAISAGSRQRKGEKP